jgi:hypothetical protein
MTKTGLEALEEDDDIFAGLGDLEVRIVICVCLSVCDMENGVRGGTTAVLNRRPSFDNSILPDQPTNRHPRRHEHTTNPTHRTWRSWRS